MNAQAKRLKTLSHLFPQTHTHAGRKQRYSSAHPYLWLPQPPSPLKENTAEVSECQQARICFTFPKCHGIWAACTNERQRGVEAGRERTWVKHGRQRGVFSTQWLITVFTPLAEAGEASHAQLTTYLWAAALWAAGSAEMWHVSDEAPVEGFHSVCYCPASLFFFKTREQSRQNKPQKVFKPRTGTAPCVHTALKHTHTYASLTGSGFRSLSSVFISDGCMPLRLTPYATQKETGAL